MDLLLLLIGLLSLLLDNSLKQRRHDHELALTLGYQKWLQRAAQSRNATDEDLLIASQVYYEALTHRLEVSVLHYGFRRRFAVTTLRKASEEFVLSLIECEALLKGGGRWVLPARASAASGNLGLLISGLVASEIDPSLPSREEIVKQINTLLAELFLRIESLESVKLRLLGRKELSRAKASFERAKEAMEPVGSGDYRELLEHARLIARRANGIGSAPMIRGASALVCHPELFFRELSSAR
ncbi:MAG: hypothetical protein MUC92_10690 [Fimbriimonadaceae bacterium]|jgi:hypothetical protein|nr:hypothetical protein [Fimbriimonadaceae bacterium]